MSENKIYDTIELEVDPVYRSGFSPTHILFFVGLKPDLLTDWQFGE